MDSDEGRVPTACTLDAERARERVARWEALSTRAQPTVTRPGPDRIEVGYPRSLDVIAELTSLAALEAECCAFLTFAVQNAADEVVLTVAPAVGAAPEVAQSLAVLTSIITGGVG